MPGLNLIEIKSQVPLGLPTFACVQEFTQFSVNVSSGSG